MIDTKELRQLAQAATPGCWYVERGNYVYGCKEVTDGEEAWHPVIACTDDDEVSINFEGNANFIAAANPAAISELLDRLEAAEGDIALKESIIDSLVSTLNAVAKERDKLKKLNSALCTNSNSQVIHTARLAEENYALRNKIAAMERQEPLYLAPGAQGEPK